jgi:hypothetical protein
VAFEDDLAALGFRPETERTPRGVRVYTAHPNPFLMFTVQAFRDGTALFTWEFAVGEYLATKGLQLGSDETLNQFLFPRADDRGPQDAAWVAGAMERAELALGDVRLDRPEE